MSSIYQYFISRKILIIFCFIFLLIRLPFLDQISIIHDERDISLTGYAIAHTGHDLTGQYLPLVLKGIGTKSPFLSVYFTAFWWLIFPVKSIFFARLPFVLITSLLPLLIHELFLTLTRDKRLSLISALIFSFSPWIYHVSRLAFDLNFALVPLLMGIILYFKKRRFLGLIFFILTFYSYQGFRVLIPILLIYLEFHFYLNHEKKILFIKNALLVSVFSLCLIASSLFVDAAVTKGRLNEIIFFNNVALSSDVIQKRNTSIAPAPVRKIFHNKLSASADYMLNNFVKGIGFNYLFKEGDPSPINGNASSGQFLFPFIAFYILGLVSLGRWDKKTRMYLYPLGFIFIGLLPSLLSSLSATFSTRSLFSAVGFAYLISLGILFYGEVTRSLNRIFKYVFMVLFLATLGISLVYFSYNYFFRRPFTVSESFFESERQLSNYLLAHQSDTLTIYHTSPQDMFLTYLFFDNTVNYNGLKLNLDEKNNQHIGNFTFINCNLHKNYMDQTGVIVFERCLSDKQYSTYLTKPGIKTIPYHDYSQKFAYFISR